MADIVTVTGAEKLLLAGDIFTTGEVVQPDVQASKKPAPLSPIIPGPFNT